MLHAVGRTDEGIAELSGLRSHLVQQYGSYSVHVRSLDRRIDQLRRLTARRFITDMAVSGAHSPPSLGAVLGAPVENRS